MLIGGTIHQVHHVEKMFCCKKTWLLGVSICSLCNFKPKEDQKASYNEGQLNKSASRVTSQYIQCVITYLFTDAFKLKMNYPCTVISRL